MKKLIYGFLFIGWVVSLTGCALPEKSKVSTPVVQSPSMQKIPPVQPNMRPPAEQVVSQPRYLDIDSDPEVVMEKDIEEVLPSMVSLNDRIFEYGRKLNRWKELDSQSVDLDLSDEEASQMVRCFRRLQNILNGYGELREKMLRARNMESAEKINKNEVFDLQQKDIAFLESTCGRLLATSEEKSIGWSRREEKADLAQLETLIDRYAENKEYEEIIQVWLKIPEQQIGRVHLRTKILYGNALMYLHQEEKAAEIYRMVVDQMSSSKEQPSDLVSLRKVLADLYTASGNYREAEIQYKKISEDYQTLGHLEEWSKLQLSILDKSMEDSPELTEYSSLLRNYLGFDPEKDGYKIVWQAEKFLANYPYSPVSSNVDAIKARVLQGADDWFNGFFETVDKLSSEKKFEEAMELLETIPADIIGTEKQIKIKEKNQELLLAAAVEKETEKMAQIQELQHQWNNGMLLVKNGRYDEALAVFTNLLDTEYSKKAEKKIEEVSLQAAKADRRKAADLFIRFTKTSDIESKKKLLIESRKLLKNILVKYPEVEIGAKVIGNIKRVEQEMMAIDPNLITLADREENMVDEDGIDTVFSSPGIPAVSGNEQIREQNIETKQP
ncbi:tetratricopeptide repeat protein [Desulfomarina sp.]